MGHNKEHLRQVFEAASPVWFRSSLTFCKGCMRVLGLGLGLPGMEGIVFDGCEK